MSGEYVGPDFRAGIASGTLQQPNLLWLEDRRSTTLEPDCGAR
jgi:hypothetical protein